MQEIKMGSIVCFTRDNVEKKGTVEKMYEDFDIVVVNVLEDKQFYKVSISDITVVSESNKQEQTPEEKTIIITQKEFKDLTLKYINTMSDNDIKTALTLFSDLLCYGLFEND